ncbi:MAG: hypothetical protein HRF45_00575 [Fimbriimonadia bacterium]|jgi:hypothetical protein
MKAITLSSLLMAAVACSATVHVGIFDDTRLWSPVYNVETGAAMTELRTIWEARGAVWHQTDMLTPEFLSQVSVFYTSQILQQNLTAEEKAAVVAWVRSGGTLVVTADCG